MNLYVHFPFCRSKCSYCALYSRVGSTAAAREEYVGSLRVKLGSVRVGLESNSVKLGSIRVDPKQSLIDPNRPYSDPNQTLIDPNRPYLDPNQTLKTIYFGGGSPALCDLSPLGPALAALSDPKSPPEFTVELHPLDVTPAKLDELKSIGVNRISMGVQSLDDNVLRAMGRGYTADEAARAFALVKSRFDNAGIDLIVGYPGDSVRWINRLANWGLRHCSAYSLQNERGLRNVPDDDTVLDEIRTVAAFLKSIGLERYEISNYAVPGFECRHNLAVWRGEDYIGFGEGACGRIGLTRTRGVKSSDPAVPFATSVSSVSPDFDLKERTMFRLRAREGLDASRFPEWIPTLERFVEEGLLAKTAAWGHAALPGSATAETPVYRLTERGTEVCDAILAEIV